MNQVRYRRGLTLLMLFLLIGHNQVTSESPSVLMDDQENLSELSCNKSVKPLLQYIVGLNYQIIAKAQEQLEKDYENRELRHKLLALSNYQDHIKTLNQHIEELRKTNEILREYFQQINNYGKSEELKLKAEDLNECIANQNKLKTQIELESKNRNEIEEKFKIDMENLKIEKDTTIKELELKLMKEIADLKTNEVNLNNELTEFKSQVLSLERQLEESQDMLLYQYKECNVSIFTKLKNDFADCKERLPIIGCQGLPSGIQTIKIPGIDPFPALCNDDIRSGGWIVIQKRFDGGVDFYRNWTEYRNGFGNLDGEFFIGLEHLYHISNFQPLQLYIEMENFDGEVDFAMYNNFTIGNENENYKLLSIEYYDGSINDQLNRNLGLEFSTYDHDNDADDLYNWAEESHGGWWHNYNYGCNINGLYYKNGTTYFKYMHWSPQKPLKSVQMLIRL